MEFVRYVIKKSSMLVPNLGLGNFFFVKWHSWEYGNGFDKTISVVH